MSSLKTSSFLRFFYLFFNLTFVDTSSDHTHISLAALEPYIQSKVGTPTANYMY